MRIQFEERSYMASSLKKPRCFILPRVPFCPSLPYVRGACVHACMRARVYVCVCGGGGGGEGGGTPNFLAIP